MDFIGILCTNFEGPKIGCMTVYAAVDEQMITLPPPPSGACLATLGHSADVYGERAGNPTIKVGGGLCANRTTAWPANGQPTIRPRPGAGPVTEM